MDEAGERIFRFTLNQSDSKEGLEERIRTDQAEKIGDSTALHDEPKNYFYAFFHPSSNRWLNERVQSDYDTEFHNYVHYSPRVKGIRTQTVTDRAVFFKNSSVDSILGILQSYALMKISPVDRIAMSHLIHDYEFLERAGKSY